MVWGVFVLSNPYGEHKAIGRICVASRFASQGKTRPGLDEPQLCEAARAVGTQRTSLGLRGSMDHFPGWLGDVMENLGSVKISLTRCTVYNGIHRVAVYSKNCCTYGSDFFCNLPTSPSTRGWRAEDKSLKVLNGLGLDKWHAVTLTRDFWIHKTKSLL